MTETLSSIIDQVSRKNGPLLPPRKILTASFIEQWPVRSQELCVEFRNLESNEEREKWLMKVFNEVLDILSETQLPSNLSIPHISKLLEDIIAGGSKYITNQELSSLVGKMFVSVSNEYPQVNENRLVALARISNSLHKELFKFSRVSAKLLNNEQAILLRHLLKKSKYELRKFNLLAECSSGYSQLVMLLVAAYNDPDKMEKIRYYVGQLDHISGKYSLDPLRCLDILLQISSDFLTEEYKFFLEFVKSTDFWPNNCASNSESYDTLNYGGNMMASNIIAFNLSRETTYKDQKYLDLVCLLIKYGFVNFISVWENIEPDNESLEHYLATFESELEAESMKGSLNPLAMAAALTSEDDDKPSSTAVKEQKEEILENEPRQANGTESDDEKSLNNRILDQGKVKLLERLLVHGCVIPALYILKIFPKIAQIDYKIPQLLSRAMEHMIEPLYESSRLYSSLELSAALPHTRLENGLISHKVRLIEEIKTHEPFSTFELRTRPVFYFPEWSEKLKKIETVDDLFALSHEFLSPLGTYLAKAPKLISKICRIGAIDIAENSESIDKWVDYTRKFIFPAVPSLGLDPITAGEIYNLMKNFPFERRYFIYNEMLTKLSQDIIAIKAGFNKTERDTRNILKALSIDTIDKESRKLAKLASTNPLAALLPAVKQIENYDKVSELVVFSAKYFNDFAYDVLQYVLLLRLTNGKHAVQPDGVNQAMWVQRLSVFVADLAKDCEQMDINNIITYIVKTLHEGNVIAVSLMRELIIKVGGIRDLNEVNLKQLNMLNAAEPLRRVARRLIFDSRDENNDIANKLLKYFANQNSVTEVIMLLYGLNLKENSKVTHSKILSSRCDEMNTLLWSFIALVKHCFKAQRFTDNVLPFDVLINEYHVSTPWAFYIWRDYMEEYGSDSGNERDNIADQMLQKATFEEIDFNNVSRELFLKFWKLSLYEIQFDKHLYDERKVVLEEEKSIASSIKKKNELSHRLKELLASCISHQKTFNQNLKMLEEQILVWKGSFLKHGSLAFFQYCIVPRVLFSPADAIYASSFLKLFDISTLLSILGQFIRSKVLCTLLFCCTRLEAGNMGIFYRELFGILEDMRKDNKLDNAQCREIYEWHSIVTDDIIETISNKNYMSIRNGIEFMKNLSYVFPVIDTQIESVCLTLEENLLDEQREDIKLPSNALLGHLKARIQKSSKLQDFCELTETEKEEQARYQSELDEIKQFETIVANEKKQAELRKKLELNKKQREEAEKARKEVKDSHSIGDIKTIVLPKGPSADRISSDSTDSTWSIDRINGGIDEVCYLLKNRDIGKLLSFLKSDIERTNLRELLKVRMPIHDLRTSVYELFEEVFLSRWGAPDNPDLTRKLEELRAAVKYINHDSIKSDSNNDLHARVTSEPVKKISRYNATISDPTKTSEDTRIKDTVTSKNDTRGKFSKSSKQNISGRYSGYVKQNDDGGEFTSDESNAKSSYTNRQQRGKYQDRSFDEEDKNRLPRAPGINKKPLNTPPGPRTLVFPERPSQGRPDNRVKRNSPSSLSFRSGSPQTGNYRRPHDTQSTEERASKRFKVDEKRFNHGKKDNNQPRNRSDERLERAGLSKDSRNQTLPQGPKPKGSVSRYSG